MLEKATEEVAVAWELQQIGSQNSGKGFPRRK